MDWFAAHSYNHLGAPLDDNKHDPISLPTPSHSNPRGDPRIGDATPCGQTFKLCFCCGVATWMAPGEPRLIGLQ
jgi:hypothetical protein